MFIYFQRFECKDFNWNLFTLNERDRSNIKNIIFGNYLLFHKTWNIDRLISILVSTRESQERVIFTIWLSLFFGQKLNSIKRKCIWLVIKFLLKRTSMDISQQIFHKRQNHNLFKCYKQQQFHQILELRTQSW